MAIGATDGLGAVTLARVAAAVGVSQGLVHHYFTSAEEMVNATFRHAAEADLDAARQTVSTAGTARAQISALFDYVFDPDSADAAVLWIDAASLSRRSPSLAKEAHDVNTGWLTFLADIVTTGTHTGEFTVTHPHTTARRLLTIIDGLGAQTGAHALAFGDEDATGANEPEPARTDLRAAATPGALPPAELKDIATDFAKHELGLVSQHDSSNSTPNV